MTLLIGGLHAQGVGLPVFRNNRQPLPLKATRFRFGIEF